MAPATSCESPTLRKGEPAVLRAEMRALWDEAAEPWNGDDPEASLTERLLDLAAIRPGDRVLDLACGSGRPTFAARERTGPSGYLLGLDLSPRAIEFARSFAAERGIVGAEFRVIDDETYLGVPPESFDGALCRHGLMWMPNPAGALLALFAALCSGGRVAVSGWGRVEPSTLSQGVPALLHEALGVTPVRPALPHPLHYPESLASLLRTAGFSRIRTETMTVSMLDADNADEWVDETIARDPSLIAAFDRAPDPIRLEARDRAVERVLAIAGAGPIEMRVEMLLAAGTKPVRPLA